MRLIASCITQLKAQGASRTCDESTEDEEEEAQRARTLAGKILVQLGVGGGGGGGRAAVQRAVGRSALGYMGLVVAYGTMEAEEGKRAMLESVWEAWFDELFDLEGHTAKGVGVWEGGWGGSVWEVLSHLLFVLLLFVL